MKTRRPLRRIADFAALLRTASLFVPGGRRAPIQLLTAQWVCCLFAVSPWASAQTASIHHISAIEAGSGTLPILTLAGTPPAPLRTYYDLFPIHVSSNLADWQPLTTVLRTNVTNEVTFADAGAPDAPARFYRIPTNDFNTPFPAPTGPHAVGTFSRMLADDSRSNRFGIRTNSSFMVTFWYPARPTIGGAPAAYTDRQLAERRAYWGGLTNRVPFLVSHALADTPVAGSAERFPVVIYTHGLGDMQGRAVRTENAEKAQELASHGYVIAAVDHTDAYGVVLPPDQLIVGRNAWSFDHLIDRLRDIGLLLDYFEALNADDPVFGGRLDLDRIGIMGWSFGGGTAGEACRLQDRLKAAVLLDGFLERMPVLLSQGLAKPFLAMVSPSSGLGPNITTLFNRSPTNVYQLSIRDAPHEAFTDNAWIVNPSAATRRRALAMNACLVSFFNKHLKGTEDTLIEDPGATYPDVTSFRKK